LKTLYLLAQHSPNRQQMKDEIGMMESLKPLISHENSEIKKYAIDVHDILSGRRSNKTTGRRNVTYGLGSSNNRAKVITLQVRGLHQATRKICEEKLLQVKGVISFTFNVAKARCIVRVKPSVAAEKLCSSIEETKIMSAQQIVKDESGEEVVLSFGKGPVVTAEEGKELPDYLPEETENEDPGEKALARTNQKSSSEKGGWFSGVTNFISNSLYW